MGIVFQRLAEHNCYNINILTMYTYRRVFYSIACRLGEMDCAIKFVGIIYHFCCVHYIDNSLVSVTCFDFVFCCVCGVVRL